MTPSELVRAVAVLALLTGVASAHGGGPSGGPSGGGGSAMPSASGGARPQDTAKSAYNAGVHSIKKAEDCDADAAKAASPDKSAKAAEKARKFYQKAAEQFIDAVGTDPSMYQAWNYLGFAKRHLGDYQDSLGAYAKALELNPRYPDAVEYRGEAYLGLNKIDDAKEAYMSLFRDSRPLADELMASMRRWTEARRKDAQGVPSEDIEAFAQWLNERAGIAAQTASLGRGAPPAVWR
jgi:tetratricopeptide (TPR) repeat protein